MAFPCRRQPRSQKSPKTERAPGAVRLREESQPIACAFNETVTDSVNKRKNSTAGRALHMKCSGEVQCPLSQGINEHFQASALPSSAEEGHQEKVARSESREATIARA